MWHLILFRSLTEITLILTCLGLAACEHPLVYHWAELELQGKLDSLTAELVDRPVVQPINAYATFKIEDEKDAVLNGRTSEYVGAPFRLVYPANKMLQQAGDATVQRWFINSKKGSKKKEIEILAQVEDLYYHDASIDSGTSRALIAVKLHVRAMADKKILLDRIYESGKQYSIYFKAKAKAGLLIGVGEQYETHYSRTVYKALLVALDEAMQDIRNQGVTY